MKQPEITVHVWKSAGVMFFNHRFYLITHIVDERPVNYTWKYFKRWL